MHTHASLVALFTVTSALIGCSSPAPFVGDDASADSGAGDDAATTDGGPTDSGTKIDAAKDSGGIVVDSGDGFGALRTACINEINKLRATEGKPAYALWTSAAIDTCVDQQATYDQQHNSPHDAWINNVYPTCNGNGQDECLGYPMTPSGIVACLDAMWAEKNQTNCSGCPACAAQYNPNCPNCDFYGQNGPECGHYVNMSALYLKKAACGFSTLSNGSWETQNFSQ